ncbi:leucine-responsive transcriptional regulator [Variovorax sp. PBL-H6]|nr:Lrp/AsnC ligand binding domain-containing protein [Variovorax sp. PBL-H6]VTU37381.1 leucine-responsive transcriptional regulator [Variovorax sp. PBL-H6]
MAGPLTTKLAEAVSLSPSAVLRRVRRVRRLGESSVVADMAHYSRFIINTLLKHPSVEDFKTSFVLDRGEGHYRCADIATGRLPSAASSL